MSAWQTDFKLSAFVLNSVGTLLGINTIRVIPSEHEKIFLTAKLITQVAYSTGHKTNYLITEELVMREIILLV